MIGDEMRVGKYECEERGAGASGPKTSATQVKIVSRSETEIDRLIEPL